MAALPTTLASRHTDPGYLNRLGVSNKTGEDSALIPNLLHPPVRSSVRRQVESGLNSVVMLGLSVSRGEGTGINDDLVRHEE